MGHPLGYVGTRTFSNIPRRTRNVKREQRPDHVLHSWSWDAAYFSRPLQLTIHDCEILPPRDTSIRATSYSRPIRFLQESHGRPGCYSFNGIARRGEGECGRGGDKM